MNPESDKEITNALLCELACRTERIIELEQIIYMLLLAQSASLVKRFRRLDALTPPAE